MSLLGFHWDPVKLAARTRMVGCPRIICGFSAVGKSHLAAARREFRDCDAFQFWTHAEGRNPLFPANYIRHILAAKTTVLAAWDKEIRDGLAEAKIPFEVVVPAMECKEEYLDRLRRRGSSDAFLEEVGQRWAEFITDLRDPRATHCYVLRPGQFISDIL